MSQYDIMVPEVWRKRITEKLTAKAKITPLVPVERYPYAEEVHHFVEKTLAEGPKKWKLGTPFPISEIVYEKKTVTISFYADGWEIPKPAVDRIRQYGIGIDPIRREIDRKSYQAGLKVDKLISDQMVADAGNTIDLTPGTDSWKDGWDFIKGSLAQAIRMGRNKNSEYDALICSPDSFEYILKSMPNAEAWFAEAQRTGKVPVILGLNTLISNNMTTPTSALVCEKGIFGTVLESYPLTTIGPKEYEEEMIWRAFFYFALGPLMNVPDAICKILDTYA